MTTDGRVEAAVRVVQERLATNGRVVATACEVFERAITKSRASEDGGHVDVHERVPTLPGVVEEAAVSTKLRSRRRNREASKRERDE